MLEDKVVFVTGAARGIGLGIARAVLESGGRVALGDRDAQALRTAQASLATDMALTKARLTSVVMDVSDPLAVEKALAKTLSHFGVLNGLVNNAGVIRFAADLDATIEDWRLQMEVNVIGTHTCCKAFANILLDQGRPGAIVNIASNAGKVGYPNMAGYNASKAALINLTRTLAAEWSAHNINVNAICPGGVYTPMLVEVAEAVGKRIGADPAELIKTMLPVQLGRHIQPVEIGRVAAFLLSDAALIIRGQAINADGGDTPY